MHVLSGGAAAAVVQGVQAEFEQATRSRIQGTFSSVVMMRDKLLGGAPCDVVILTKPLIEQLIASGHVVPGSERSLGLAKTGVAARSASPHPSVSTPAELHAAPCPAPGTHFPHPDTAPPGLPFLTAPTPLGFD